MTLNNDLSSSIVVDGFDTGRTVSINGAELKVKGNFTSSQDGSFTFNNTLNVTDDVIISARFVNFGGDLIGNGDITQGYTGQYKGTLLLGDPDGNGNGSFGGGISVDNVDLCVETGPTIFGSSAKGTSIINGGLYLESISQSVTISEPFNLNNARIDAWAGRCNMGGGGNEQKLPYIVTLSGAISASNGVTYGGTVDALLSGVVNGAISLRQGSLGNLTIGSSTQVSGEVTVPIEESDDCESSFAVGKNYKYIVSASCTNTTAYIAGILMGSGALGNTNVESGGKIAPGNSPGVLSTGNLAFEEGGIYDFEIAGDEAGQYDQINVTGTVNLGNGILSISQLDGFKPSAGKSFVIIANDGDDVVEGTFKDLPQGATITVDGAAYTISYTGGDGNDVELTAIPSGSNTGNPKNSTPVAYIVGAGLISAAIVVKKLKKLQRRR